MPWTADDAPRHTKLASNAKLRRMWAKAANSALEETGDEGYAVRVANSAVKKAVEHREMAKEAEGRRR